MGPFILAWLVGEGIVIYRGMKRPDKGQTTVAGKTVLVPPAPGQLLFSSGVFVALALLAEAGPNARTSAIWLAWGFDIAAWMRLFDKWDGTLSQKGPWPPTAMAKDTEVIPSGGWFTAQGHKLQKSSDTNPPSSPGIVRTV